jgi:hypothetical protein
MRSWDFNASASFFLMFLTHRFVKRKCTSNDIDYYNVVFILDFMTNLT